MGMNLERMDWAGNDFDHLGVARGTGGHVQKIVYLATRAAMGLRLSL